MQTANTNPNCLIFPPAPFPKSPMPSNFTAGVLLPHPSPFLLATASAVKFNPRRTSARARRRMTRDYGESNQDEEFEYNQEIALLETYTQSVRDEILLVRAAVDGEEVEVVIFKGFSSCLSNETSSNPARSVIPARAEIRSVDRVRGPFDPSNVEYIERGLSFDEIKRRLSAK